MGDFPFLEHLSLKYLDIAEKSKHWTDYLKAHGLANACLSRDPTREDVKRRIYDLESRWYNGSHPKTYSEHQHRIADHKTQLTKLRNKTAQKLDTLDTMHAGFSADHMFGRENILKLLNFSNEVFEMSSECTANLVEFSRSIILSSMDLLDEAPCSFAVIGLGSLARGEATPYSDLEYAFLVESGFSNYKYFTELAVESYFCIGNLGESPLKCFSIEELNVKDGERDKLFVDQPPVNGFKIDGISQKAGNIPTGHGREGGKRLIRSVDELMNLYKSSLMAPADPEVPGDMSDLLFSPVLIFGHHGGEKLLDQFMAKRKVYESSVASADPHSIDKRLLTLVTDITQHPFLPGRKFDEMLESSNVQVKSDIFRYPTLLSTNLKISSNLDTNYPWETLQWFCDNHVLSLNNYAYLKIVLGLSIFIRTKAYVALGSQYELLSLQPEVVSSQHDEPPNRFHVPQKIFLNLGCLLIPIKRSIEKSIVRARSSNMGLSGVLMPDIIKSMLGEFQVVDDFLLKAEVLHFMGHFKKALESIKSAFGESCVSDAFKFIQAVLRQYPDRQSKKSWVKSLQMMAEILLGLRRERTALDFCSWISFFTKSETERISWDMQSVQCLMTINEYKSAESQLRQIEMRLRNLLSVDISEPLHTYVISLLKGAGGDKSRKHRALGVSDIVCRMFLHYSKARNGLHCNQQALEDLMCAESVLNVRAEKVDVRPALMYVYSHKGDIYRGIGEYDASENMYTSAIALCTSLYGSYAATSDIAILHSNLSLLYVDMGKYSQAEQLTQQALEMLTEIVGNNNRTTMKTMYQLGGIYYHQGKYLDALKLFRQILTFDRSSKVGVDPFDVIHNTKCSVGEMYNHLGEYRSASIFLSAAQLLCNPLGLLVMTSYDTNLYTQHLPSAMRYVEKVMRSQSTQDKMQSLLDLGQVCINISQGYVALGYLTAALSIEAKAPVFIFYQDILLNISKGWACLQNYKTAVQFSALVLRSEGETSEGHTGGAHYIIGDCYNRLGFYKKSWSHLHTALCLYQNLPKYRSFVLMLAKTHLSIAKLLFKLSRVSESLDHAMKAAQLTDGLLSDQEKTTWEYIDINEQALMVRDILRSGCIFG